MKLVLIALAVTHNWYSGHHDPVTGYECCDNKDCRVISPRYVEPRRAATSTSAPGPRQDTSSPRTGFWRAKTASITSAHPPRI